MEMQGKVVSHDEEKIGEARKWIIEQGFAFVARYSEVPHVMLNLFCNGRLPKQVALKVACKVLKLKEELEELLKDI
ncbi:hypothetical protein G7K71_08460 [Desulfofundulus sp. TPOSR]|uniref:hypothetical protein n=1 Tax=Desulfofundulus sp. TPOSR TaxID=2714340 RepID=UPI00140BFE47|nr:hypothetical protein [Desulfofundulus sp. TPOSR]NHM25426.1 hypothetical protein [Desulfofundulus sp. TPOSR]NHM27015.1 hypothetical protein [Desulfofundulus sp. TPOSR]